MANRAGTWTLKLDQQVTEQIRSAVVAGLSEAALDVLADANRTVPRESGDLERSGKVAVDAPRLLAVIGYGAGEEFKGYAIRQHEDLTLKHNAGRGAKWLERALNKAAHGPALATIARSIRRVTE